MFFLLDLPASIIFSFGAIIIIFDMTFPCFAPILVCPCGVADSDAYNRLYSLAKKREEKLQAKRSQAPPGCTFSPQLKSRRPKTAGSGKNRYETLYENAKRISAKREAKLKSLESEYSFRPQLQTKAKVNRKGNVYDALYEKVRLPCKGSSFYHQPLTAIATPQAKAQETKRREKEAMMASEYTFSPRINKSRSAEKLKTPVIERLYRKDYIASKMDAWEKARAARELEGCTFLPRTNGKQERKFLAHFPSLLPALLNRFLPQAKSLVKWAKPFLTSCIQITRRLALGAMPMRLSAANHYFPLVPPFVLGVCGRRFKKRSAASVLRRSTRNPVVTLSVRTWI